MERCWEKLCPEFYSWFLLTHRSKEFLQSVIQSAREDSNALNLFYQNNIVVLHAIEKRIQSFKMDSVLEVVNTVNILIGRKENK